MTYRHDSDIPWLYGWVGDKDRTESARWRNITMWRNKTGEVVSENIINNYKDKHKLVAWAVSNCKTESRYSCRNRNP